MSKFQVLVKPIQLLDHPNKNIKVVRVSGYLSILPKGKFKDGDLVAYIPEKAILPQKVLEKLGLQNRLSGENRNVVKAMEIHGILSQGLCYKALEGWVEGQDVTEELGITKYRPPTSPRIEGEIFKIGEDRCVPPLTIKEIKAYPLLLQKEEEVVLTEKIHGTYIQIGLMPTNMRHPEHGRLLVSSKELADKGFAFVPKKGTENIYLQTAQGLDKVQKALTSPSQKSLPLSSWLKRIPVFILGEIFGEGVQDLSYGAPEKAPLFRVFDVFLGLARNGRYLGDEELNQFCESMELTRVPVLYRGFFVKELLEVFTQGKETLSGKALHTREGIVITPVIERKSLSMGRVQSKSLSKEFLLR